eukprot:IDg23500t1
MVEWPRDTPKYSVMRACFTCWLASSRGGCVSAGVTIVHFGTFHCMSCSSAQFVAVWSRVASCSLVLALSCTSSANRTTGSVRLAALFPLSPLRTCP